MSPDPRTWRLPDAAGALIAAVRRRLRLVAAMEALAVAMTIAAAVGAIVALAGRLTPLAMVAAALAGGAGGAALWWRARRQWTAGRIAAAVERRVPLDNLLVTAVDLETAPRPVRASLLTALETQLEARVRPLSAAAIVPVGRAVGMAAAIAVSASAALWTMSAWGPRRVDLATGAAPVDAGSEAAGAGTLRVIVTPPAYSGAAPFTVENVPEVRVLEGSAVRIELIGAAVPMQVAEAGQPAQDLRREADRQTASLAAAETRFLVLRPRDPGGPAERLLAVLVTPDAAPTVRIRQPAKDLLFGEATAVVPVEIEAADDLALGTLALRYTKASGSGENLTFVEGEIPVRIQRVQNDRWEARADLSLAGLELQQGDTLVYRAVATDRRPGREPSTSEAYLVEVGAQTEAASAGFALPPDKDRQALSQQMVIVKTERLHAARGRLSADDLREQAQGLAVEQRMVRAEFVFMTGGEVEDEVAEAEHSHDLVEGRFENTAQIELLAAISAMSRAEARLNDGDTAEALVAERAALAALQKAFDRRRYLLRTLSERARLDLTRRLSGDLKEAQSWRWPLPPARQEAALPPLEALARDLAAARTGPANVASLAARLGAVDASADEVRQAALALSAVADGAPEQRAAAIDEALRLVAIRARRTLAPAGTGVPADPSAGRYADAAAGGRQR